MVEVFIISRLSGAMQVGSRVLEMGCLLNWRSAAAQHGDEASSSPSRKDCDAEADHHDTEALGRDQFLPDAVFDRSRRYARSCGPSRFLR